jgi:hypothetical protein
MPSSARTPRILAIAALLAGLPLAACSAHSSATSCSGLTCAVTLNGSGADVDVLGQHLAFAGTQDGRASVRVGDRSASCTEGQTVSAGPLRLTCSQITADSVRLSASLG